MNMLDAAQVARIAGDLPALPAAAMEVLRSFEQPDAGIDILADKVSKDQALAAKALRLANSSFYGLQRKVATIQQAIAVLGFDSVRTLIAVAAVADIFRHGKHGPSDINAFWRHAIGTALCSKMIARHLKLNQEQAFVGGLLHDIGKLVLSSQLPDRYAQVVTYRTAHDCYAMEAEQAVLGTDHAAIGAALAERWKFPLSIQRSIANHHAPDTADLGDIPAVVHVAEAMAHGLDFACQEDDLVPVVSNEAWDSLHLDTGAFRRICRGAETEFEEACRILEH